MKDTILLRAIVSESSVYREFLAPETNSKCLCNSELDTAKQKRVYRNQSTEI